MLNVENFGHMKNQKYLTIKEKSEENVVPVAKKIWGLKKLDKIY